MSLLPTRRRQPGLSPRADIDAFFEDFFGNGFSAALPIATRLPEVFGRPFPAVDLAETERDFVATFELPGLEEKDVEVQLVGDQLVVSGERKWEEKGKHKGCYRAELQYGAFRRSIPLPGGLRLDPDAVTATFRKGLLEVHVPKVEPTPAKRIPVKNG